MLMCSLGSLCWFGSPRTHGSATSRGERGWEVLFYTLHKHNQQWQVAAFSTVQAQLPLHCASCRFLCGPLVNLSWMTSLMAWMHADLPMEKIKTASVSSLSVDVVSVENQTDAWWCEMLQGEANMTFTCSKLLQISINHYFALPGVQTNFKSDIVSLEFYSQDPL